MRVERLHVGAALVFAASAALTIAWCAAMPHCGMWMRMPGQGWVDHATMFLGMWTVMMIAMMVPALAPMLQRYQRAMRLDPGARSQSRTGAAVSSACLLACVTAGYFAVWIALGAALFPFGVALSGLAMRETVIADAMPSLSGLVVLAAGASQFTRWKTRQLACCRQSVDCWRDTRPNYRAALRHGAKIGLRCVQCCAALTAVLLVIGVMDLLAMALVTIAISAERLTSDRSFAARLNGGVLLAMGAWMLSGLL